MKEWRRDRKHVELRAEASRRLIPRPMLRLYVSVGNETFRHELCLYAGIAADGFDDVVSCSIAWVTPPTWLVHFLWRVVPRRWRG